MSRTSSVVEVNGNRYDAITGELISKVKKASSRLGTSSGKKMIDGFVISSHQKTGSNRTQKRAGRPLPATGMHTKNQRSKTLMRKAVKKPSSLAITKESSLRTRSPAHNPVRELRAKTIDKHSGVSRFGFLPSSTKSTQTVAAEVRPRTKRHSSAEAAPAGPRVPSMVTSVSHQKLERLLDEALVRADAHKQMMKGGRASGFGYRRLPRWLVITLIALLLVLVSAFLIWENLPSVAVRVAAARAHVKASMPAYTPSGYSFASPINYKPGSVSLNYVNKLDGGNGFVLTQKTSNWDSQSLANSLPKDTPVQTSQVDGTTVYIYGDSEDATWVNHGVLYNLDNKSGLTSDQVMKIVGSL